MAADKKVVRKSSRRKKASKGRTNKRDAWTAPAEADPGLGPGASAGLEPPTLIAANPFDGRCVNKRTRMDGRRSKFTARAREQFLNALSLCGNVAEACRVIRVSRRAAYDVRAEDADFANLWNEAIEIAGDRVEREAYRRAVDGWLEPVFFQGVPVSLVRKYSDRMLEIVLKGTRPKFRENFKVDLDGKLSLADLFAKVDRGSGDG